MTVDDSDGDGDDDDDGDGDADSDNDSGIDSDSDNRYDNNNGGDDVRLEVYQGNLDMHVALYDEGKKHELIGEGTLRLHEVMDKGELDVWFVTKNKKGAPSGDVYFELTFYAVAPPQAPPVPHPQHHPIRHNQPQLGFAPMNRPLPLPHAPPAPMHGNNLGAPVPFPGNPYPNPQRAYPIPQGHTLPPQQNTPPRPYGNIKIHPSSLNNTSLVTSTHPTPPFQPKTQYIPKPKVQANNFGRSPNNMPQMPPSNFRPQGNAPLPGPPRFTGPQPHSQPGIHQMPMHMPVPHPVGQNVGYGQNLSRLPRRTPGMQNTPLVTPHVQYNYNLGSFP
ncbi:hypothetical protein BGZ76_001724 [Entomortierella beljakovae]|nr:hypothetical protein BGZ76_001724 [Entomortierella beljakovae]